MQFGTQETTKILDDNGSTVTDKVDYKDGVAKRPTRKLYKFRERVHTREEERKKYLEFSVELEDNSNMLDPSWNIERSAIGDKQGYYYVVKSYTLLEY